MASIFCAAASLWTHSAIARPRPLVPEQHSVGRKLSTRTASMSDRQPTTWKLAEETTASLRSFLWGLRRLDSLTAAGLPRR